MKDDLKWLAENVEFPDDESVTRVALDPDGEVRFGSDVSERSCYDFYPEKTIRASGLTNNYFGDRNLGYKREEFFKAKSELNK